MSPASVRSIRSSIEARSPLANTVTKTTSARPIISAAEVTAVRPGWRVEFSRASRPTSFVERSIGQETKRAAGPTKRGEISAMPRIRITAPPAAPSSFVEVSPPSASRPATTSPAPSRISRPASHGVRRAQRPRVGAVASRSASTGATRVARSAGASAPASVTSVPTSRQTMIVRLSSTRLVVGRSMPSALNSALIAFAKPSPARMPTTEPITPIVSASSSTELSTWRRVAPSVRSSASSRERCATVIENVLKIRNAPTSTAMNANASRPVVRNARPSRMSSPSLSASCAAVRTCAVGGSSDAIWRWRLALADAVAAGDEREVDLALLVEQLLGGREVEDDEGGPAEPGRLADGGEADELEGALRRGRGDRDLVAELEVLLVGGGGVERDLVLALRRAALGEADRGERRRHVGRGDRRRPAGRDDLAVLADDRGDVVDLPRHLLHVGQVA